MVSMVQHYFGSDLIGRREDKELKYCIMNLAELPQVGKQ
jgi:hypothetical protein